jgi:hypothetical protein
VKYQGSKTRLAKAIGGIIRPALRDGGRYVEPFVGSCAVAVQLVPDADISALSDAHLDMVLLWNAAIDGWTPPTTVTYEDHQRLKDAEPSPLRGFVGCQSFAGQFFGSFARDGGRGDDFVGAATRSLARRAAVLRDAGVRLEHRDYRDTDVRPGDVVYLDPPYAGRHPYRATGPFDSDALWRQAREWSDAGAHVYVSEYIAPPDWCELWSTERQDAIRSNRAGKTVTDRLFVHERSPLASAGAGDLSPLMASTQ